MYIKQLNMYLAVFTKKYRVIVETYYALGLSKFFVQGKI